MTEVQHELLKPFDYDYKGSTEVAQFILMQEFGAKHIQYTAPIRQAIMRAIREAQEAAKGAQPADGGEGEITGADLIGMLEGSSEDMAQLFLWFKELLVKSKLFRADDTVVMNNLLYDKLSGDDLYAMFGEYMRAFIAASLLK